MWHLRFEPVVVLRDFFPASENFPVSIDLTVCRWNYFEGSFVFENGGSAVFDRFVGKSANLDDPSIGQAFVLILNCLEKRGRFMFFLSVWNEFHCLSKFPGF